MCEVDLLIFDLDGTLVDTRQDLTNSVNYARQRFGLSSLELEEVMQHVGDGARNFIKRSFPGATGDTVDEAMTLFRRHYREHLLDFSNFYPNVRDVLSHFQQKKLAVVSNKPEEFTKKILRGLQVETLFQEILGGDSFSAMKPDPRPILHILQRLKTKPTQAVIVGDSPSDIEAGRASGILTCAATYGYRSKKILLQARPDFIVDDFAELPEILQ
ncbi:HAD-IA family hydrolase [bacterium]|nr:HAD-IA family hydrolase [bacterium]